MIRETEKLILQEWQDYFKTKMQKAMRSWVRTLQAPFTEWIVWKTNFYIEKPVAKWGYSNKK